MKYNKINENLPIQEKEIEVGEYKIKIKNYIPVDKKLEMIGRVISSSADENRFYNPGKLDVILDIFLIRYYSDIDFGEEVDQTSRLYDDIKLNGLLDRVINAIPSSEIDWIKNTLNATVKSIYDYQNSIFGIMNQLTKDYSNLGIKTDEITAALKDPENLELIKGILTKLG